MTRALGLVWIFFASIALAGCSTSLPMYPRTTDRDALLIIAERLASVHTVSATVDMALSSADGRSVKLDGAFVAELPVRARLRAWKFGTPVFDLTVLPEGVWVVAEEQVGVSDEHFDVASLPAASISPALELLAPEYFRGAVPQPGASNERLLVVAGAALGREDVRCEIDRATLTPRRFTVPFEAAASELILDQYAVIAGVVWPRRLEFRGPAGEVVVRFDEIEINSELQDRAFIPPARARKLQ